MVTNLELATRLHNWGTGEWIRRLRLMTEDERRREMLRVSADCVEALDEIQRLERRAPEPSEDLTLQFPRAWAPYLQAVIIGALDDFDNQGDCRWHLNELAKQLGKASENREAEPR